MTAAPNAKAPDVASAEGLQEHHQPTVAIVAPSAEACNAKLTANLIAAFALRGHSVYELAGGGFAVTRWGLVKQVPDLRALSAFARQVGAT